MIGKHIDMSTSHRFFTAENMAIVANMIQSQVREMTGTEEYVYHIRTEKLPIAMMIIAEENAGLLNAPNVTDAVDRLNRQTIEREVHRLTIPSAEGEYVGIGHAPNAGPTSGGRIGSNGRISARLFQHRLKNTRDPDHAPNGANYTFGSNHMAKYHRLFRQHQTNIIHRGGGLSTRFDMTKPAFDRMQSR